jgi:hypothetical protein
MENPMPKVHMGKVNAYVVLIVVAVLLVINAPSPIGASSPDKALATPKATEEACTKNDVVKRLRESLTYDEFDVSYIRVQNEVVLNIWFVDPELDPKAAGASIKKGAALAISDAALMTQQIVSADPCIGELFSYINPIVVDKGYNGWLSGTITPSNVPSNAKPNSTEMQKFEKSIKLGYSRQDKTAVVKKAPKGSCTWAEARKDMLSNQFSPDDPLHSFTYVLDGNGINVYAEFDLTPEIVSNKQMLIALITADTMNVLIPLRCLNPVPDHIYVQVVDINGNYLLVGRMPPDVINEKDAGTVLGKFEVLINGLTK